MAAEETEYKQQRHLYVDTANFVHVQHGQLTDILYTLLVFLVPFDLF